MLRVLLADDEQPILTGLSKLIRWEDYGFEIVGLCNRAAAAVETALKTKPHLVLLDIEMPGMSGLEMMERLRGELPDTKFVILSAYDVFAYAQKALGLGAYRYLLKPIDQEALLDLLRDIGELAALRGAEEQALQKQADEAIGQDKVIAAYMIQEVLSARIPLWNEKQKLQYAALESGFFFWTVFVLFDRAVGENGAYGLPFPQSREADLESILQQLRPTTFFREGDTTVLICDHPLSAEVKILTDNTVTLGFTSRREGLREGRAYLLRQLRVFEQAAFFACKGARLQLGGGRALPACDGEMARRFVALEEKIRLPFVHGVNDLNSDAVEQLLEETAAFVALHWRELPVGSIRGFFRQFLQDVQKELEGGAASEELLEQEAVWTPGIMSSLEDIISYLRGIGLQWMAAVGESGEGRGNLVYAVKDYCKAHYQECNLKLNVIADRFFVNYTYLSYIFKRETGVNFYKYLVELRLGEAKRLLETTNLSIGRIALRVGYPDSKNFHHVFKKTLGISPNQYRKSG